MIASLYRIFVIGRITLTEAVRQKVLSVLLIFGLVLVCSSVLVSSLATPGLDAAGLFAEQIKFVKDFGCGAIGLFGVAIALRATAELIPQELQNRTVYTILAKPVRRADFILGKFFGVVLLIALFVTLMSLAFAATLYWQEQVGIAQTDASYAQGQPTWEQEKGIVEQYDDEVRQVVAQVKDPQAQAQKISALDSEFRLKVSNWEMTRTYVGLYDRDIAQLKAQVRDPQLIEAILLIFAKLIMTAAIALLISSFASSSYFTLICTVMIYLIAHMEGTAREYWLSRGAEISIWQSSLVGSVSLLIPDMNAFTIVDEILAGNHVPWCHTLHLLGYANVYIIVALAVSVVIFDYREL